MKRSKKLPAFLSKTEQDQLFAVFNIKYICSMRNRTLCWFLLKTGLRVSEVIELKWRDVNLLTGQVIVLNGKGGKDRIVYISEKTIDVLSKWKERQCSEWGKSEHVFTNRYCRKLAEIFFDSLNNSVANECLST